MSAFQAGPGDGDGDGDGSDGGLVERVRELRARILFDHGRRPAFRGADGTHTDDQELDHGAWHFVARREVGGPVLGYVRLATPRSARLFQSRAFLGEERYADVLRVHGLGDVDVFEHSRLVVEHRARKLGLGVYLNAMAIGAARHLGGKAMIGTSGTADGQDRFHHRFGFEPVEGTRRYVEQYTEDVVVLLYRVAEASGSRYQYARLVEQAEIDFPGVVVDPRTEAGAGARAVIPMPRRREAPEGLAAGRGDGSWRPTLFQVTGDEERWTLEGLLAGGAVREVCDTVGAQLAELALCREPGLGADPRALQDAIVTQLAGAQAWEYGTWAWYPWSGKLVHVLPREEFRLVRTDRNRGRIERPQQRALFERRIGIVGLSVGSCAALTFAMEGIGGAYKLADFDELGLSNLNRLRAGVGDLGVNKAVLSARAMFEIDPYLDIEIFPGGLTEETMGEFFSGGNGAVDLLVEECDTPFVKLAAREWARELRIPVVMDANDRGLLDVERFDLEPSRPLLHGLLGDATSRDMLDLTREQKIELILAMVDRDRISPELAASIPQIGRTLCSWPQLASGVALGGALTAHAARRILLGLPCASGRFYTDLDVMVRPETSTVPRRPAGVA
ncbi:MAG TPA: ThiF family adenylyltransferase [Actinospica sp.]|nr:ThiF family adenylyltransferase [Actinospica sp.]